jgi:hypothetical protein
MDNKGNKNVFVQAWNNTFFPNGEYKEGKLEIAITLFLPSGEKASFHASVSPRTNINSLAKAYVDHSSAIIDKESIPESNPVNPVPNEEIPRQQEATEANKKLIAIEHLIYRNNEYIVTHLEVDGVEEYSIKNLHGANIATTTIAGKDIIKRYRNGEFKQIK